MLTSIQRNLNFIYWVLLMLCYSIGSLAGSHKSMLPRLLEAKLGYMNILMTPLCVGFSAKKPYRVCPCCSLSRWTSHKLWLTPGWRFHRPGIPYEVHNRYIGQSFLHLIFSFCLLCPRESNNIFLSRTVNTSVKWVIRGPKISWNRVASGG